MAACDVWFTQGLCITRMSIIQGPHWWTFWTMIIKWDVDCSSCFICGCGGGGCFPKDQVSIPTPLPSLILHLFLVLLLYMVYLGDPESSSRLFCVLLTYSKNAWYFFSKQDLDRKNFYNAVCKKFIYIF